MVDDHALRHLAYPVLHQFHSPDPKREPARAMLLLADALVLQRCHANGDGTPSPLLALLEASIDNYLALVGRERHPHFDPDSESYRQASARDIFETTQLSDLEWATLRDYLPRRARLQSLCRRAGWSGFRA